MKRNYTSGTADSITFFTGVEIEHTPAYGKNTLFVTGVQPTQEIQDWLDDFNSYEDTSKHIKHIFFGANHSFHPENHLEWQRWEIKDEVLRKDIMPEGAKVHESFLTSMHPEDAVKWFGVAPPDLSLVARARGADWLYSYLKGFYVDQSPTRPTGVNNLYFKDVAMPNVFWDLQGLQKPVINLHEGSPVIERLEKVSKGKLSDEEFDQTMSDLVAFLVYAAEPAQYARLSLGKYVIFVLLVLAVILFKLKKEYWKDIE